MRRGGEPLAMMIVRLSEVADMSEAKFAKGSEEWQMFMDYWELCKKYWEPEESDEWWDEALKEVDKLAKKYGSTVFIRGLCMALVNELEVKHVSFKKSC